MKEITIKVGDEELRDGFQDDNGLCPIALAVYPFVMDYIDVFVMGGKLLIEETGVQGNYYEIELPKAAKEKHDAFNQGEEVSPFEFNVALPEWALWEEENADVADDNSSGHTGSETG